MKNLFHFAVVCFACAFSLSAQDDQISYSYDQSQTSSQAVEVSKDASGQGFSVVLHTKALPSMGSPEEIFAELNKLISQKTVVPLEQRYPGVHFKVKDEDLEYDRLYFDQSDDGEKFLIRVKIYGSLDASSSNGELVGSTTPPDMICTWEGSISKDGEKKVDSFKCTGGSNGKIEVDSSLKNGSVEQQLTWAHENAHQQDNIRYLKKGISVVLDSKAFDNVSGIEDIRKKWNKVKARIQIVKEARAVLAEVEQIKKIKNLTKEQKEKYLDQLSNNPAEISKITNGGKNITPYEFDTEEIYLGKIGKKDVKIKASSLNGKYVVTYGAAYTQLKGQNLTRLLDNLAKEAYNILKEDLTNALLESIGKDETLKVEDKKGKTNVTKKVTFGNNTQQDGSIRGNGNIFALIEKLFIDELNKAYTGPGEPTSEEAMNYFRSANPILEKISVTDGNRAAAQEKLKECLEKNRIKITSFYGSFRVDQISIDDFVKGVKEAKGEEQSTNDVKRMRQLMKQFFILFNKLMREIYPVREERIKMRNEIDGIKEMQ